MKRLVRFIVVAVLMLPIVSNFQVGARAQDEPLRFVFVTHDLGAGIFAPVRTGMEDACAMIGAECEFIGPQTYDPAEQVSLLEAAIETNPDGIATTRPEPGTYDAVIQRAIDAGIKVVTFNTNDPTADEAVPAPFVGQNFTNYGVVWAREVMRLLPDGGKIAVTNCCPGHFALEERLRSFRETLETEGEGKYEVAEVLVIGTSESEAYGAVEAYYQANPDVNMITGVDYYTYVTAQFIKNNGLEGQLLTGGSDLAPAMVDGLNEGYVQFALGQNPYLQGFYPVMMMHQEIEFGIRPITIDTGTDVVTPENVEQYNPEFR
jgi:ABC-type sugar transport system substrate-binding protein